MQILALETSTEHGGCALWRDGDLLESACPDGRSHSETLLPLVRELLARAGTTVNALDGIAFGVGPGAFTGLRVACGAAQGLALAADLPLLPVTSLECMAAASGGTQVLALLDARMGEVYAAAYRNAVASPVLIDEIRVIPPAELAWPESGAGWLACGNALAAYPALAERLVSAGFSLQPDTLPLAAWVARLAAPQLAAGGGIDPALAAPLYIRDKVAKTVAERLREGGRA
jgi:tRNA threonylcarbamoyladenosine biosynthesis protein TsaB